jgi:outer membrane protein assembly factor BamB
MVALIDLGEEHEVPDESVPDRGFSRGERRVIGLAVCVALLAVMGSSSPPSPLQLPRPTFIEAATGSVYLAGDVLVTVQAGSPQPDLVAVGTNDGVQRWRVRMPGGGLQLYGVSQAGDVLIVAVMNNLADDPVRTMYALDRTTGRQLWHDPSTYLGIVAGGRSLMTVEFGPANGQKWFVARDPATGRDRWRLPVKPAQDWGLYLTGDQVAGILLLSAGHSRVQLIDAVTGLTTAERDLPSRSADFVQQIGEKLLVPYDAPSGRRLSALRLPTLEPLWDVAHPATRIPNYTFDCAPVICVDDGSQVSMLDANSGQPRWHAELRAYYAAAPGLLYVGDRPGHATLRDASTGDVLLPMGPWRVLGYDGQWLLMVIQGPDRTWFAAVDPQSPRSGLRLLGYGGPSLFPCWLVKPVVACRSFNGVDIYHYPLTSWAGPVLVAVPSSEDG